MCGLGTWELLIVLAIVLLLFGATRLPQLGRALGDTVRNFKKGTEGPEPVEGASSKPLNSKKKAKRESIEAHEVAQLVDNNGGDDDDERDDGARKDSRDD